MPSGAPPTTSRWGRSTSWPTHAGMREPFVPEHVKPSTGWARALRHGARAEPRVGSRGNRFIRERDLDAVFVAGPGHGGPGPNACAWLEGTYSELFPSITQDAAGMAAFFHQFSFPGGVPSHCAPETPGSFHEGGELGYSLLHAYGAVFDDPDLVVFCVVGDGEAETGPLATSWHGHRFVDPAHDGAVLPDPAPQRVHQDRRQPPRCWPASPRTTSSPCCAATATTHTSSRATTRRSCTRRWRRRWAPASMRSPTSRSELVRAATMSTLADGR